MKRLVAMQGGCTRHLTVVINYEGDIADSQHRGIYRAAEVAEVVDRAVAFPEDGVRPRGKPRQYGVCAATRDSHGLAEVIDAEGHADRIAGERRELPDLARKGTPDHGLEVENLRPSAVDCQFTRTFGILVAIFRKSGDGAEIVDLARAAVSAELAVGPFQGRERSHHAALPEERKALVAGAISAEVLLNLGPSMGFLPNPRPGRSH
jgi:hypothetical protein